MRFNLNNFAKEITLQEGKKKSLGIGQVKEVMRILLTELSKMEYIDVEDILRRYRKK